MSSGRTHTERLIGINNSCQVTQEAPQCVVAALESNWRQDWRTRSSEASPLCNVRSAIVERKREEITILKNEMMTDVLGNHKARSSNTGVGQASGAADGGVLRIVVLDLLVTQKLGTVLFRA